MWRRNDKKILLKQIKHPWAVATTLVALGLGTLLSQFAFAGVLTCAIRSSACNAGEATIFKISGTSNAHAELPGQSNYTNLVCCGGVTGVGNSCSGNFITVLNLQNATNSHVEENNQGNYTNGVCISAPAGDPLSVGYQASNCTGFDATVAAISAATNAHVDNGGTYTTFVCASGDIATVSCSSNITSTDFGTILLNSFATSTPDASSTMTCNSTTGCSLTISDAGNGSNPGLSTTSPAYLIASVSGTSTLAAGTEGYGANATSSAGGTGALNIGTRYARGPSDGTIYGGLTLAGNTLASSSAAITNKQLLVRHGVATGASTQKSGYTDTITYSCAVN